MSELDCRHCLPNGNAQTRWVCPTAWELRPGVLNVFWCRMLLPSQRTSLLEIRSGPLYLKSKNVQKFSIPPPPVSVCVLSCL